MATQSEKKSSGTLSKLGAALAFIVAKGKALLAVIFKVKGLATVLSMLLSIFVYWKTWHLGLAGAVGFVLLLLVHEYGHVIALKRLGVPASAPMFIPFLGAVIGMKAMPKNAKDEAFMAISGPILGSIGALACFGIYALTHQHLWLWLASTGFLLNLFNLIPVSPLDGGRVIGAVWRGFWYVGLAALAGLAVYEKSLFMWYIAIIALLEIDSRYKRVPAIVYLAGAVGTVLFGVFSHSILLFILTALFAAFLVWQFKSRLEDGGRSERFMSEEKKEEQARYFQVTPVARFVITATYLGLAGVLAALLYWTAILSSHVAIG
ncbi:MAG TPA: site-2 protease family protein [Planktothrix sp.]|jgi:Zn-dependent protease